MFWFKGRIPKHDFLVWVLARVRLHVPLECPLCSTNMESRQHLFFDCAFSSEVWSFFYSRLHLLPPSLLDDGIRWLKDPSRDSNIVFIVRLAFQACIYGIWRERNTRLHSQVSRPAAVVISEICLILRAKLDILSREQRNLPSTVTYLSNWSLHFV